MELEMKKSRRKWPEERKKTFPVFASFFSTTTAQRQVSVWNPIKLDKKLLRKSRKFEKRVPKLMS